MCEGAVNDPIVRRERAHRRAVAMIILADFETILRYVETVRM